jgi:hypothetical protein
MKNPDLSRTGERGSAGPKVLLVFVVLILAAHAGYQFIPVAYQAASFKQEMETAVVKGLAAPGQTKPTEVVAATIRRAASDYDVPPDAVIDIRPVGGVVQAHVSFTKTVPILPFGLYKYEYRFDHTARPVGYLLKE